jgi:hypothetical protein
VTGYCGSVGPRRNGRGSAIAAPRVATPFIGIRERKGRGGSGSDSESRGGAAAEIGEQHRGNQPTRKEVWTLPEPMQEATGGLCAGAAGAPATSGRSPSEIKKMMTTGARYSGRVALRREQCNMYA